MDNKASFVFFAYCSSGGGAVKRLFSLLLCAVMLTGLLCSCGRKNEEKEVVTEKYSGTAADFFADVAAVGGFKCEYSQNGEKKVIAGENAKDIYSLIRSKLKTAEETAEGEYGGEQLDLLFKAENGQTNPDGTQKIKYYGSVTVYDGDVLSFSGSPDATVKLYYKLPAGAFNQIKEALI